MSSVYDDEKQRSRATGSSHPHHGGSHHDSFDDIVSNYDKTASPAQEDQNSAAARDILAREQEAAKGDVSGSIAPGAPTSGGSSHTAGADTSSGKATGQADAKDSRADRLAKLEKKFTKDDGDDAPVAASTRKKGRIRSTWARFSRRRKIAIVSVAGSVIVGGGGLGFYSVIQGPLQFIHAAQLFSQFHLDEKIGQGDNRAIRIARNIRYIAKGEPQKTRMGFLGNKIADKFEGKFNAAGIKSEYSGVRGTFLGYTIDPEKLRGDDYDTLRDRSPAAVQQYLKERYNIDAKVVGNKLRVSGTGLSYKQERQLMRSTMKLAGYHGTTGALGARIMGVRNLIDWHPVKRIDRKINESIDKRLDAWKKRLRQQVSRGASAANASTDVRRNQDGNPNGSSGDDKSELDKLIEEGKQANQDFLEGKPGALEKFRTSIAGKFAGGAAGLVSIACLALYFFENLDLINQQNVILPMTRMGMDMVATGSQIQDGTDVDQEQLGFYEDLMNDRREPKDKNDTNAKTNWSEARSIQAELGQPLSGPDLPMSARVNQDGNIIGRFVAAIPGIRDTCEVVSSTVGQIILTGISLVLTGPISTIISTIVGAVGLPYLIDELTKTFAAAPIDPLAEGALRGNFMNYGTRLAARDVALSNGGLPISDEEDRRLGLLEQELQSQEFRSQSLAYRLFDAHDARSLFSRVTDRMAPDPLTNVAKLGSSVLNIGGTVSNVAAIPFTQTLHAAPVKNYDYGFPDYAYTLSEMNDPRFANPFQNADLAADALDASSGFPADSPDNYANRAQKCFGVGLERIVVDNAPQWTVKAPQAGNVPLQKTVRDPANKCLDQSESWMRVRFFIIDSNMMNALACYESIGQDPALTQACVDVGIEPATGVVTSNTSPTENYATRNIKPTESKPAKPSQHLAINFMADSPLPQVFTEVLGWRPQATELLQP